MQNASRGEFAFVGDTILGEVNQMVRERWSGDVGGNSYPSGPVVTSPSPVKRSRKHEL